MEDDVRGAGILRHPKLYDDFVIAPRQRPEFAEAIDQHVSRYFGRVASVWHELASHLIGVHVYVVPPTDERPFHTIVTSGMSDRPMTMPAAHGVAPHAELMMCLPPEWPIDTDCLNDDQAGWPLRMLKQVARLPHEYGTWIGEWHSVPHGEPYAPGSPFTGVVVTPMLRAPEEARIIQIPGGPDVDLLAVVPLHPAELALKMEEGTDALIDALDRGGVTELLDPNRPSTVY